MQAKDIMKKQVATVSPEMSLREAAKLFSNRQITGAPVVNLHGNLVGVVSQTDLVRREAERGLREVPNYHRGEGSWLRSCGFHIEDPDVTPVEHVMTPWAISFDEETSVLDLAKYMLQKHIHRVIITKRGKIAGIVTAMDLLRAMVASAEKKKR